MYIVISEVEQYSQSVVNKHREFQGLSTLKYKAKVIQLIKIFRFKLEATIKKPKVMVGTSTLFHRC